SHRASAGEGAPHRPREPGGRGTARPGAGAGSSDPGDPPRRSAPAARPAFIRASADGGRIAAGAGEARGRRSRPARRRGRRGAAGEMTRLTQRGKEARPPRSVRIVSRLGGTLLTTLMRTTRFERSGVQYYDA